MIILIVLGCCVSAIQSFQANGKNRMKSFLQFANGLIFQIQKKKKQLRISANFITERQLNSDKTLVAMEYCHPPPPPLLTQQRK